MSSLETTTLYRPVGPGQLQSIVESGWRRFPPRWPQQKYFYPMIYESFARRIARQWHVERSGVGYVMAFRVRRRYLEQLPVYIVGGPEHKEYRIPAQDMACFNDQIVGSIQAIACYGLDQTDSMAG